MICADPPSRGAWSAGLTLADQLVSSASNFLLGVVIARAGGADALGAFGVAFLVWLAVVGLNRALVTEPMTVAGSAVVEPEEIRRGMAASIAVGLGAAGVLAAACVMVGVAGGGVAGVACLLPWLPSLLVQDYFRSISFRRRRPAQALVSDGAFAFLQGLLTVGLLLAGAGGVGTFLAAWGSGATVGALVGLWQSGVPPRLAGGFAPLRELWPRSRWFVAEFSTSFPADQGYLLLLPILLGTAQFGIYRAGAALIGPVVVVFLAGGNLGLPESVRRFRGGGVAGLSAYAPRLTSGVLGLTVLYCGCIALFPEPILRLTFGPDFTGAATVTRLVAIQYVLLALGFGFGVALKAADRMRLLWALRGMTVVVSVSATLLLTSWLGLLGAGIASCVAGAAYAIGVTVGYRRLMRSPV